MVNGQLVADVLNSQHAGTGATWRINTTCRGRRHIVSPCAQIVGKVLILDKMSNSRLDLLDVVSTNALMSRVMPSRLDPHWPVHAVMLLVFALSQFLTPSTRLVIMLVFFGASDSALMLTLCALQMLVLLLLCSCGILTTYPKIS